MSTTSQSTIRLSSPLCAQLVLPLVMATLLCKKHFVATEATLVLRVSCTSELKLTTFLLWLKTQDISDISQDQGSVTLSVDVSWAG